MSKIKTEFNRLQNEYNYIKKRLLSYEEEAKKSLSVDFEKSVKEFTEKKSAELEQKLQENTISVDMDKIRPIWKNLLTHKDDFFTCAKAILQLIEEIERKDFYMLPSDLFSPSGYQVLTKQLPNYIISGKASNLQEAIECYYIDYGKN